MGRAPCCDKANVKKGPWSPEEDARLKDYMDKNGFSGNWIALPQKAGLKRCGKSCRLRWLNYLRPNIKHGGFSDHEDRIICTLYASIGSRWSIIAAQLPGRTDNDIKNYWNTKLKKKLMGMMIPFPFDQNKIQSLPLLSSTLSQIYRDSSSSHYTTSSSKSLSHQQNLLYNNMSINYPLTTTNHSYYNQMNPPIMHFHPSGSSSSDGSCCQTQTQTQISHVKAEIKQEQMNYEIHQSFMSNNFYDQETHKLLMDCNNCGDQISTWADQKPNIFSTNSQLFSDLEEVKQLVNSSSLFLNDENKMHERDMYYY